MFDAQCGNSILWLDLNFWNRHPLASAFCFWFFVSYIFFLLSVCVCVCVFVLFCFCSFFLFVCLFRIFTTRWDVVFTTQSCGHWPVRRPHCRTAPSPFTVASRWSDATSSCCNRCGTLRWCSKPIRQRCRAQITESSALVDRSCRALPFNAQVGPCYLICYPFHWYSSTGIGNEFCWMLTLPTQQCNGVRK